MSNILIKMDILSKHVHFYHGMGFRVKAMVLDHFSPEQIDHSCPELNASYLNSYDHWI